MRKKNSTVLLLLTVARFGGGGLRVDSGLLSVCLSLERSETEEAIAELRGAGLLEVVAGGGLGITSEGLEAISWATASPTTGNERLWREEALTGVTSGGRRSAISRAVVQTVGEVRTPRDVEARLIRQLEDRCRALLQECARCGLRPLGDFREDRGGRTRGTCRDCEAADARERRAQKKLDLGCASRK